MLKSSLPTQSKRVCCVQESPSYSLQPRRFVLKENEFQQMIAVVRPPTGLLCPRGGFCRAVDSHKKCCTHILTLTLWDQHTQHHSSWFHSVRQVLNIEDRCGFLVIINKRQSHVYALKKTHQIDSTIRNWPTTNEHDSDDVAISAAGDFYANLLTRFGLRWSPSSSSFCSGRPVRLAQSYYGMNF